MSEDLERLGRQAGIAKWMGIIGIPLGPIMGLGLLVVLPMLMMIAGGVAYVVRTSL